VYPISPKEAEKKKTAGLFLSYARLRVKLNEPEHQIWGHIEKNNRQFKITHHGIMDFIKAIMRDIEPRGMYLKYKFIA
jgi:hypothetical protein